MALRPRINEFVFDNPGTDNAEFIEVLGDATTDLSSYSLVLIDGDGTSAGLITYVSPVGTTNSAGYWATALLAGALQNGTQTLFLVQGFTGAVNNDLDTNNDGVLDATPWTSITDAVAVSDGGASDRTYAGFALSVSSTIGGYSRIPDGTDTDAAGDWTRDDFDPSNGNTAGQAVITRGAANVLTSAAGITVAPTAIAVTEGGATASFNVVLASAPTADVTIGIAGNADLGVSATSLVFTAANWNIAQTVTVTAVDDTLAEGSESLTIVTAAAVSTDANYSGLNAADVSVTVTDNDAVGIVIAPNPLAAVEGGAATGFAVSLASQPTADVTIVLTGNADLTLGTTSLTFTALNWNLAQNVSVSAVDDGLAEGAEAVSITGAASSADLAYNGIAVPTVTVDVTDPVVVVPAKINEFVFNHDGTDVNEYVEIKAAPGADLSSYRLVVLEGDNGSNRGAVTAILTPGTANAAGYWVSNFLTTLQNGTQSLLLVRNPSGLTNGADLDTNDDGVLDSTPWAAIEDAVAINDGGAGDLTYAGAAVLGAGYDGLPFVPGGASRLPEGADSDTAGDWVRNDFDRAGIPGITGTPAAGEALNTPGAANAYAVAPVAGFQIVPASLAITEGDGPTALSIRLTTAPTADVSFTLTGSADISLGAGSLTFTTANWNQFQSVSVTAVDDALSEGTEFDSIVLGAASSADAAYAGLNPADVAVTITDNEPLPLTAIHTIQGAAHVSAYADQAVRTSGIVIARDTTGQIGFWIQDPNPDADVATSEGIFVFTGSAAGLPAIGDAVVVAGTVREYLPGGNSANLSTTRVESTGISITSSGNALPAATLIGNAGRVPPKAAIYNDAPGNINAGAGDFDPANEGIDFFESLEGMRVAVSNTVVVGATNSFNETWVLADLGAGSAGRSIRGGVLLGQGDDNPERIQLQYDSGVIASGGVNVNVAARLGTVTGVMSYDFGNYEVAMTATPTVSATGVVQEKTSLVGDATRLTISEFNVENLDPSDTKFDELARLFADHLKKPDILALQEVQDSSGPTNDGVTDATLTAAKLIAAIYAKTGLVYSYADVSPANNTSGGEPGGNIRTAYLYNTARVELVPGSLRPITDTAATATDAFAGSRQPLAADFRFNNNNVTLINVHSSSKGGGTSLFGSQQPSVNGGEAARIAQATEIKAAVDGILAGNAAARIGIMGDFNEFAWNASQQVLTGGASPVLFDLAALLPNSDRYSYVFDGSTQQLDHTLGTASFRSGAAHDIVHINAEFNDSVRISDHDPAITRLTLAALGTPEAPSFTGGPSNATGTYLMQAGATVTGGAGADILIARAGTGTLAGGAGADLFTFISGLAGGSVTIADFTAADHLTLQGFASGAQSAALASQVVTGAGTTITLGDGTSVLLAGVSGLSNSAFY